MKIFSPGLLAAALVMAVGSSPALGQNQIVGPGTSIASGVFEKKSPQQIVSMLTSKGANASLVQQDNGSPVIIIQDNQSAFYIRLIGCDPSDAAGSCYGMETYAFVPHNGLSADRLNQLNLNHRFVSGQFLETRVLIKRAAIFNGGITEGHFFGNIAVFISDLNMMAGSVQKATTLVKNDNTAAKKVMVTFTRDVAEAGEELDALKDLTGTIGGQPLNTRTVATEFTMPDGLAAYLPK